MKKTLLFFAAMLSLVLLGTGNLQAQTNLLSNGGFEEWNSENKPTDWEGLSNQKAALSQSTDAHSGSYSVQITAMKGSNRRLGSNSLMLKPGKYKISFYAKGGRIRTGYGIVKNDKIDGNTGYKYLDGTYELSADEWTLVEGEFELTEVTQTEIIIMNPKASGDYTHTNALIDDVTLTTENGGISDEEVEVKYYDFKKVDKVTSGKQYLLVADGKYAQALSSNYGYIKMASQAVTGDQVQLNELSNAFTFEYVEGQGYTIKQNDGRYIYQTLNSRGEAYTNFNVNASPTGAQYWEVDAEDDGTFTITNIEMAQFIQYSTGAGSFGCYPGAQENALLPYLYELQGESTTPVEKTYTQATIASLGALTSDLSDVKLTFTNAKVLYVDAQGDNGNNYYFREGDNAIMAYRTKALTFNANDVINGTVVVDFKYYNGIPELIDQAETKLSDLTVTASSEEAQPVETTVADVLALNHKCDLVKLTGVTIVEDGGKYYAVSGEQRVQFYKGIDVAAYANGAACDVVALFNAVYQGAAQLMPLSVTQDGEVTVVPAPVFETAAGSYEGQVEVVIAVPEDCFVYYTTDGSDPDDAATLYTAPFTLTETTTVKAITYDADDQTSVIVSATYTITEPVQEVEGDLVKFDFVANTWALPVSTGSDANAGNVTEIEQDGVTLVFDWPEGNTTLPRLWQGTNYTDLRFYQNQSVEIVAPAGRTISQVTFYANSASQINVTTTGGLQIKGEKISGVESSAVTKARAIYQPEAAFSTETFTATEGRVTLTGIDVVLTKSVGITEAERSADSMKAYDLQGRRIQQLQKGVYILGGRKVLK